MKDEGDILEEVAVLIEDSRFYERVYYFLEKKIAKKGKSSKNLVERIVTEEYSQLSRRVDESGLQESCSVRNVLKCQKMANLLVDEEGVLQKEYVSRFIDALRSHMYLLGPGKESDAKRNEHILNVLAILLNDKQVDRLIKAIGKPHMHKLADEVIRRTLGLEPKTAVTDAHARKAAVAALLCYLRQNVGSCFATAPAILVQTEQAANFLKDIQEMLATGRLKRTFGGVEYAVPLSYRSGAGDLRRAFLFYPGGMEEDLTIWKSPPLIRAFESVGIIDKGLKVKEKLAACKKLLTSAVADEKDTPVVSTVENLLRKCLLKHFSLTEEDIKEYELRPKEMIQTSLLMQPGAASKALGGVGARCQQFLSSLRVAKDTFKDFADNALLKTWEFTLASFSETKLQFTTWNLYASLGLKMEDKGGIGPCLYDILKRKLDECNKKVEDLQFEYEQSYNYLQHLQRRLRRVSSEDEARWLKADYQAKSYEFNQLEEMRDIAHNKARRYAHLYQGLVDLYFHLFPNYFQEIYDPDIIDVVSGPFDDSPAGFRLLYKHGRANTSQWSLITNHMEFIDALAGFFTATEPELTSSPEMKGLEDDIGEIVTSIVSHVRSKEFLETAFWRMAEAHNAPLIKDPLENLEKIEKKPWVYTSGGALSTLVSCYFCLDGRPTEKARWVENPAELLVFLIDAIKEMPAKVQEEFEKNCEKRVLIHSPTHAFLLKPGYKRFLEGWKSKQFTYTWVRDEVIRPGEYFINKIFLDDERMQFITDTLSKLVPASHRHYFKETFSRIGGSMQAADFRQHIVDSITLTKGLQQRGRGVLSASQIDSVLFSLLPVFPSYQLQERVEAIVSQLPGITDERREDMSRLLKEISGRVGAPKTIGADHLRNVVKALLGLTASQTSWEHDYSRLIAQIAQHEGFALPAPFIFADTNWVKDYFAFLVNPGTGKFELWRVDYTGTVGAPLHEWKMWLDGSRKHPDWGVYIKPHEYVLA